MKLRKRTKSAIMSVVAVLILLFGCPGSIIGVAEVICEQDIKDWLPIYPGAEVVEQIYNFIRPRAFGETFMTLSTPDDAETVRQFYRDNVIRIMNGGGGRGLASTNWQIVENESGEGSLIYLYSECGIN